MKRIALVVAVSVLPVVDAAAQPWPSFRGGDRSGVATRGGPLTWDVSRSRNIVWKVPIPGLGHSSPIVWGDRVFVTTAVPGQAADTSVKTGDVKAAGIGAARDMVSHTWQLHAFDRASGRVVWTRDAYTGVPRVKRHVKASHASATPATDGRYIVALLGSEGLFCFDMNGELKWRQDLGALSVGLADDPTYEWGPASSPVIAGSRVLVQNDRYKDSYLAAFDLETGRELWRSSREELPSWATPLVVTTGGRTLVVTNSPRQIRAHEVESGRVVWSMTDPQGEVKVPSPVGADDLVVVTGGYPPAGRPIYALKVDASGEVSSVAPGSGLAWRADRGSPYTGTPLVLDGVLYAITDNGILSAYDVRTGERIYQHRLAPGAAGFSASPIAAGDRLYFASEDGQVFVVRTGRRFELLATNDMGEMVMATPALSDGVMFVRTRSQLYAVRDASSTSSASADVDLQF